MFLFDIQQQHNPNQSDELHLENETNIQVMASDRINIPKEKWSQSWLRVLTSLLLHARTQGNYLFDSLSMLHDNLNSYSCQDPECSPTPQEVHLLEDLELKITE
jgi:alpha-amylase/alpha-mannosidase (GH57 family)